MKIAHSIFILLVSYFTFSQKTVNEKQLTKSESKLFLQQELYSGMVFNQFGNNQVKSIYKVNQGLVKGKMIEYLFDIEFKNYQDTTELNKLNFDLTIKSNELEAIFPKHINIFNLAKDYLDYEIGGDKKWIALEKKNKQGKLKSKKKEIFDKYVQLVKSNDSSNLILFELNQEISIIKFKINKETQKPSFIGKKSKEFEQENFIADGNAIIYDSFGNKFGEGNFIKGSQNGAWVYYFNNGAKMADVNFLNGNGIISDSSGIPKNGREGLFNSYYKNGNPETIQTLKSGKFDGVYNSFYENGNKKQVSNYKEGELDGVYNSFYENGKPKDVRNYTAGKLNGLYSFYDENGNKKEVSNYKEGELDGVYNYYYENGKPKDVRNYTAGKLNGLYSFYDENGNKKEVSNYKSGEFDGLVTLFYENGNKKQVSNYKFGKLEGLETQYDDLGLKIIERNYSNGLLNGKLTFYEKAGVKNYEVETIKGKIHGPFVRYFENGKIYQKGLIDTTFAPNIFFKIYFKLPEKDEVNKVYLQKIKEVSEYNEDGSIKFHYFFNKDGTKKKPKVVLNSAELNKSYKCECCKAKINGVINGYMADGTKNSISVLSLFDDELLPQLASLGFANKYDFFRSVFPYCTLKCARTCH